MRSFRYYLPRTNLIFGDGTLENIGLEAKKFGKKALVVTGKRSMEKLGFLQKTIDFLKKEGLDVVHFNEVEPNPTVKTVDKGAKKAIDEDCDVVIGLGGGSAMDTAKNIAIVAGHFEGDDISIWEFTDLYDTPRKVTEKTLPVIAITSTSGTGSHVNSCGVFTNEDTKQKIGVVSPFSYPKVSIVDIDILSCMPPSLTAQTGFDAMTHIIEAFVSKKVDPVTELFCIRGMGLIFQYLPKAYENGSNMEAREAMALADTYAGWALTTTQTVLPHALSHPISAFYPNIAHGVALAAVTPEIMRFNIEKGDEVAVKKYCQIAEAAGEKIKDCSKKEALRSVKAIEDLLKEIDLYISLEELGVKEDKFEGMVESAFSSLKGLIEANPASATREDVLGLYKESME